MERSLVPTRLTAVRATTGGKRVAIIDASSHPSTLPVYVTPEEARDIINAAGGFRDRLLLETIWQTGGRISEVLRLRATDVNVREGTLQMANLKQRRPSTKVVYVSIDLTAQLRSLAKDLRISLSGYLFQSRQGESHPLSRCQAYRILSEAAREAEVYKVHPLSGRIAPAWPHTFRHGAAMHLLRETLRLDYVQGQLGHMSIETTKGYLRLADADKRRLRDQVSY